MRESVGRREALVDLAALAACAALAALGCGRSRPPTPAARPEPKEAPLLTSPAVDLVPAAGLVWLVDLRLRSIFATPDLLPALDLVLPSASLDRWAAAHGGVDLRQLPELAVAQYEEALLAVATGVFDPPRVERAFRDRVDTLDGRAIDRANDPRGQPLEPIARLWGTSRGAREQIALLGREAIALERGRFGPLRASEAFAEQKLKRAKPALQAEPLAKTAEQLGPAPLRAFAPGPFTGDWAKALGGLLRVSEAAGIAVTPARASESRPGHPRVDCTLLLTGAFGDSAPDAAALLAREVDRIARDPLGKLLGLAASIEPPRTRARPELVAIDLALDALELARGVRAATEASMAEIMSY